MGKSESQMDIMEKSNKPGRRRWTATEISLFVLLLLVSCALAGLVVLYTSVVKGEHPLPPHPLSPGPRSHVTFATWVEIERRDFRGARRHRGRWW